MPPERLQISIAGIQVAFFLRRASMIKPLRKRYSGFLKKGKPVLTIHCAFTAKPVSSRSDVWVDFQAGAYSAGRSDFYCEWSGDTGQLRAISSVFAFDACLRIIYATLLPGFGGALFHAAGVVLREGAVLFPGPSGSGKTTLSRLLQTPVLNDEIVAVRKIAGKGFIASGTPFWGEMGTGPAWTTLSPLRCVYCHEKSEENRVSPIELSEAVKNLMKCLCWFLKENRQVKQAVEVVFSLVKFVPIKRLQFSKSAESVNLLLKSGGAAHYG